MGPIHSAPRPDGQATQQGLEPPHTGTGTPAHAGSRGTASPALDPKREGGHRRGGVCCSAPAMTPALQSGRELRAGQAARRGLGLTEGRQGSQWGSSWSKPSGWGVDRRLHRVAPLPPAQGWELKPINDSCQQLPSGWQWPHRGQGAPCHKRFGVPPYNSFRPWERGSSTLPKTCHQIHSLWGGGVGQWDPGEIHHNLA